ncbi:hypothetical protein FNF29_01029 [Cafeteria roenbergensis]|uniref:C2HC/C3H-type domain-containing protein n=1 Tax=Cafeteria roenbergensis TaxID=33653 RepID=A0A5A8CU46_CAFRO|nr:hypothetical protein FNF29_01029 [Cafeteria roenbergensis]|eukprot:KAA0156239.1 hypothetical protein FNF29_01029 [Cafeteria roenbergensis]
MAFASRNAAQAKQWADKRRVALERARRLREDHSKGQPTEEHTFRPSTNPRREEPESSDVLAFGTEGAIPGPDDHPDAWRGRAGGDPAAGGIPREPRGQGRPAQAGRIPPRRNISMDGGPGGAGAPDQPSQRQAEADNLFFSMLRGGGDDDEGPRMVVHGPGAGSTGSRGSSVASSAARGSSSREASGGRGARPDAGAVGDGASSRAPLRRKASRSGPSRSAQRPPWNNDTTGEVAMSPAHDAAGPSGRPAGPGRSIAAAAADVDRPRSRLVRGSSARSQGRSDPSAGMADGRGREAPQRGAAGFGIPGPRSGMATPRSSRGEPVDWQPPPYRGMVRFLPDGTTEAVVAGGSFGGGGAGAGAGGAPIADDDEDDFFDDLGTGAQAFAPPEAAAPGRGGVSLDDVAGSDPDAWRRDGVGAGSAAWSPAHGDHAAQRPGRDGRTAGQRAGSRVTVGGRAPWRGGGGRADEEDDAQAYGREEEGDDGEAAFRSRPAEAGFPANRRAQGGGFGGAGAGGVGSSGGSLGGRGVAHDRYGGDGAGGSSMAGGSRDRWDEEEEEEEEEEVGADGGGGMSEYPEPDEEDDGVRVECSTCGRKFRPDALEKHARVCLKVFQKKRRKFDSTRGGPPAGSAAGGADAAARAKREAWRQKSSQLREAMKASRMITKAQKEGKDLRDLPPMPAAAPDPSLVPCPHCGRTFNAVAAERHIPKCATTKAKPSRLARGGGVGGAWRRK